MKTSEISRIFYDYQELIKTATLIYDKMIEFGMIRGGNNIYVHSVEDNVVQICITTYNNDNNDHNIYADIPINWFSDGFDIEKGVKDFMKPIDEEARRRKELSDLPF